jgi:hypothetical protein
LHTLDWAEADLPVIESYMAVSVGVGGAVG